MHALIAPTLWIATFAGAGAAQDGAAAAPQPQAEAAEPVPMQEAFEALAAKDDTAAIDALFRARALEVIYLVDGYLETWLAGQEKSGGAKNAETDRFLDLALKAAARADAVFEVDAFSRYANAWKGWTAEQRQEFRAGQRAFQEARAAQEAKDYEAARAAYVKSLGLAEPLGDLWGIAYAEAALSDLAFGNGDLDEAIERQQRALDIFESLRHERMARSFKALAVFHERKVDLAKAREVLEEALAIAKSLGRDEAGLKADLARICRKMGDEAAAKAFEEG